DVGQGKVRGVMHCFSSSQKLAEESLALGFYISFSGIITFKKSDELREVVKYVPLDRILVETDAPYLAPLPHRGKRNEPAFVVHTAQMVAELKGVSPEEVAKQTTKNFFKLFTKIKPSGDDE
ncbi:MAG: TatD family hydrolase, partial [Alphaproteobacteria bacterium]|nr:TatD family hydrolase [Alphaproteobacteria bacterium]